MKLKRLSSAQIIALGFITVIIAGAFLLMLPASSKNGEWTPPLDAIFTATSATCVTGLIVFDTFTHWSIFGQIVILTLIQIGGLGFLTVIAMFSFFARRKIQLHERKLLMQSAGTMHLGGITTLIRKILIGTAIFEASGAILLAIRFCPQYGFGKGLYNAVFHSISAFCNAGFDLMGKNEQFSSLVSYDDDPLVCLTISALIIIGGIGFLVWSDIAKNRFRFRDYSLHSKIVLTSTFLFIVLGWVFFFFTEKNASMSGMSLGSRMLNSFFQSVTTRTAGFNTIDQTALSDSGLAATMILMLVGGSPGSTAGGIKTTTVAAIILSTIASVKNHSGVTAFKKRIDDRIIRQACAIITIYAGAAFIASVVIAATEPVGLPGAMYEVVSAIGTVGLSRGVIPSFGIASKMILAALMYAGRIGGLSFALVFFENRQPVELTRPTEKIIVG